MQQRRVYQPPRLLRGIEPSVQVIAEAMASGSEAGKRYAEKFPGQPFCPTWLAGAYEIDTRGKAWGDGAFDAYKNAAKHVIETARKGNAA